VGQYILIYGFHEAHCQAAIRPSPVRQPVGVPVGAPEGRQEARIDEAQGMWHTGIQDAK
jgi:hypothetical protein